MSAARTAMRAMVAVGSKEIDVVPLIGTLDDLRAVQWVSADGRTDVVVGETAYTLGFGEFRRGVITKIGRKRITVAFTTPSTVTEAARRGHGVTVYASPQEARLVRVFRPAGV